MVIELPGLRPSFAVGQPLNLNVTEQIEYDAKCLEAYFRQLFAMAVASSQEFSTATTSEEAEYFIAHNVAAFIRPDMVCNVYSLVDFWLPKLCCFHERKSNLALSHKDIKGASALDAYHKYLTKVAALSLQDAQPSYCHLENLRMVRNCDIHGGGHIDEPQRIKFEKIPGITVFGSLVNFSVSDVDAEYNLLMSAGLQPVMPLEDHPWGDRGFAVQDPNGVALYIYSEREPNAEFKQYYKT